MSKADYLKINSVEDYVEAAVYAREAKRPLHFLAGGTDLMVEQHEAGNSLQLTGKAHLEDNCLLADISGWEELKHYREEEDVSLSIGSLCTHAFLRRELPSWASVLAQASGSVGSPQIRNRGTVGGNCANGAPAADTPPALVLLESEVEILREKNGEAKTECLLLSEYFQRREEYDEALILRFIIPQAKKKRTSAFYKQGKRNALAISTVTVAAEAVFSAAEKGVSVDEISFVCGAVTAYPYGCSSKEPKILATRDDCLVYAKELAAQCVDEMNDIFGYRASRAHKEQVIGGLLYEFLTAKGLEGSK